MDLIESLKTMGLTEYEGKVYSALVLFDRAEVKRIYEYLNVPKPSVYQSLRALMEKGLVMMVTSKPAIYRAVPPKIALKHLMEVHKNAEKTALAELEHLEGSNLEIEDINIIWTLFGEKNVEHTMEELMSKARSSMKLVLSKKYLDYLSIVSGKELKIELVIFGKDTSLAENYELNDLTVHDACGIDLSSFGDFYKYFSSAALLSPEQRSELILIYIDDDEFMYVPPFPEKTKPGVFSKNPYLVNMVNTIFGAVWDHTPEVARK